MAVDKPINPEPSPIENLSSIDIPLEEEQIAVDFQSNLAEVLPDNELNSLSSELRQQYEDDKESRSDWIDSYTKGLDLLGFKYNERSQPFQGASGVTHPLLAESVTQFQSQAYKELLPAGGPVKCNIVGDITTEVEQQAQRV